MSTETVQVKRRATTPQQWIHAGHEVQAGQIVTVDRDQAKRLFAADIADPVAESAPAAPAAKAKADPKADAS